MKQKLLMTTLLAFLLLAAFGLNAQKAESNGRYFIVELETDQIDKKDMIDKVMQILQARLDGVGVKGSVSRFNKRGDRIEVKVFGTHDPNTIRGLFVNHQIEFRAVVSRSSPNPYDSYISYEEARSKVTDDQEIKLYKSDQDEPEHFVILQRKAIISGRDLTKARAFSRSGSDEENSIEFSLSTHGGEALGDWTGENISNYMAIVLNDKVISIAFIRSQIFDEAEINGRFSKAEAEAVASSLQSGQLPIRLTIVSEGSLN